MDRCRWSDEDNEKLIAGVLSIPTIPQFLERKERPPLSSLIER
jgi:hypothetical protein